MTFIWAYSVYSRLVAIYFLNRFIHSRKTACKATFQSHLEHPPMLQETDLHPRMRGLWDIFWHGRRDKSPMGRDQGSRRMRANFIRFSVNIKLITWRYASAHCPHSSTIFTRCALLQLSPTGTMALISQRCNSRRHFSRTLIKWNLRGFQTIMTMNFFDWIVCRSLSGIFSSRGSQTNS
jgi:hypothetical protein